MYLFTAVGFVFAASLFPIGCFWAPALIAFLSLVALLALTGCLPLFDPVGFFEGYFPFPDSLDFDLETFVFDPPPLSPVPPVGVAFFAFVSAEFLPANFSQTLPKL